MNDQPRSVDARCACTVLFIDPRCPHHGAHEYHGAPDDPADETS